jgi:Spy/CpxP family protein refolding chaperone
MKTIKINSAMWMSAIVIAFFMLSADVMAQQGQGIRSGKRFNRIKMMSFDKGNFEPGMRLKAMLNLTDEQFEQIKVLRLENQKKRLPVRNEIGEKKARLKTLTIADKVEMKAINRIIDDIAKLMAKQMKSKTAHHQAIRLLLTDEQRIKFDVMKHHRGQKGKRMKQGRKTGYERSGKPV